MAEIRAQESVSDDSLREATGRGRTEWHALLAEAGASEWPHPDIAAWLVEEHGVPGWWAQGITVGFEQAIGRRKPGQRADGSFETSASRSLGGEREAVVAAFVDELSARFGEPVALKPESRWTTGRWSDGAHRIALSVDDSAGERIKVVLTGTRILDENELPVVKQRLRDVLDAVTGSMT